MRDLSIIGSDFSSPGIVDALSDMMPMYESHFVDLSFFVKKPAGLRFVSTYPIAIFPSRWNYLKWK